MASLADLFSPTFLMFLGVLVLVVALLVVYFESKMRDQNHKIASMLSLVSTLAEDMNGVKMGLNQLAVTRMGGSIPQNFEQPLENSRVPYNQESKLIEVSDGEDDDDDDIDIDEEIVTDEEEDDDEDDDIDEDGDDDDESNHDVVKVLKIDMNSQNQYEDSLSENNLELDDLDDELSEVQSLSSKSSKLSDKLEETVFEKTFQEPLNISADFKTISINLEEPHQDSLDYKKLSLPKLRSIVSEKGLASDASKLKKNELLKLLGAE
jgi:hypothetical protein